MGLKKSKLKVYSVDDNGENHDRFEDLSNELIYELFDYLSFHDISLAFGNLNSRLQNLINDYPHYVNLQQYKPNDNLLLPRYINSLRISARYQLEFINLSNIISLKNLILSNIPTYHVLPLINTVPLNELEYVYLGACPSPNYNGSEEQLKEIQQKMLSLGELKLKVCVFRMKLLINIDKLPIQLPTLEYLRIDGCENISIVNKLLDRMVNLRSLHTSILESTHINNYYIEHKNKHQCLTNLTIRYHDNIPLEELISLFYPNGSRVKNLTIKIHFVKLNNTDEETRTQKFRERIIFIINHALPQLTNFQLRQLFSRNFGVCYREPSSPYVEIIPSSLDHPSYRVSIDTQFVSLWRNET